MQSLLNLFEQMVRLPLGMLPDAGPAARSRAPRAERPRDAAAAQSGPAPAPQARAQTAPPSAPALPDLNAEINPFAEVQQWVDRAAWINSFVLPDPRQPPAAIPAPGHPGRVIGWHGSETLHRFEIDLLLPTRETAVRAVNRVGQSAGRLDLRWLVIPEDFVARPDREPPPTVFDPERSQRFVLQRDRFTFGDSGDGFEGFGTGRTFPRGAGGRQQPVVAAIGNIMRGYGKLQGLQGTYVLGGELSPERGFTGDILLRVVDPQGVLRAGSEIAPLVPQPDPDPRVTYLMIRSQKSGPSQRTTYSFKPDGSVRGLNVPQELRCARATFASEGAGGLRSQFQIGSVIGHELGFVAVNPAVRGPDQGTADNPSRFQGVGEYVLVDPAGHRLGGFTAQFLEGRTFNMELAGHPGQPAARFGFFGPLCEGTGCFSGVEGLLLGTTGVSFSPHVFSNLYVLRLIDPDGRFRAALHEGKSCLS